MLELTLSYYYVELTMVGLDLRVHTNTLAGYCIPTCYYILACVNKLVRSISGSPARRLGVGNIPIM